MSLTPPQSPPSWSHSPEDIIRLNNEYIAANRVVQDAVGALASKDCNFTSQVFVALAEADARFEAGTEPLAFYQNVSPSKELRDASNEAESIVRQFEIESSMRLDVYNAKIAAKKNLEESGEWEKLSPEEKRLAEKS
ncbi:hypothetical protein C0993_008501, partial [Termitomyces sp. T159_Od127]